MSTSTKPTSQAEDIIRRFGDYKDMATALSRVSPKRVSPTTVHTWKRSGHIPFSKWKLIIAAAEISDIDLDAIDFIADIIAYQKQKRADRQRRCSLRPQPIATKELEGAA